jgi:hypothetical protein
VVIDPTPRAGSDAQPVDARPEPDGE